MKRCPNEGCEMKDLQFKGVRRLLKCWRHFLYPTSIYTYLYIRFPTPTKIIHFACRSGLTHLRSQPWDRTKATTTLTNRDSLPPSYAVCLSVSVSVSVLARQTADKPHPRQSIDSNAAGAHKSAGAPDHILMEE